MKNVMISAKYNPKVYYAASHRLETLIAFPFYRRIQKGRIAPREGDPGDLVER